MQSLTEELTTLTGLADCHRSSPQEQERAEKSQKLEQRQEEKSKSQRTQLNQAHPGEPRDCNGQAHRLENYCFTYFIKKSFKT